MKTGNLLMEIYWRLERVLAPGLQYSQTAYQEVLGKSVTAETVWLDVGCGWHLLPSWNARAEEELVGRAGSIVGLDLDEDALSKHRTITSRVVGNLDSLPFPADSFGLVTANMVVEHLQDPAASFGEVCRVLKPGGLLLFHTPNARSFTVGLGRWMPERLKGVLIRILEDRRPEDIFTTHYRANTPETIEKLARRAGLMVRDTMLIPSTATFARVPPIAALELLWIRLTMKSRMAPWRANLISILQKPGPRS